jgi:hypothetical protein
MLVDEDVDVIVDVDAGVCALWSHKSWFTHYSQMHTYCTVSPEVGRPPYLTAFAPGPVIPDVLAVWGKILS